MTTSNERIEGQPAFVLHSRPYRETSALVEFFTEDFGRIGLLVKGVRQAKSKQRIATQSFSPLKIGWSGRGELKTLTGVESVRYLPLLQGRALCCGLYLNELLVRLLPNRDPSPRLFAFYQLAIESLGDADMEETLLRIFEHRLLDELGLAPSFSVDGLSHQPISPDRRYDWRETCGFVETCGDGQARSFLGAHILAMGQDDYSEADVRRAAKRIMRQLLQQQLGDKPLASRALFADMVGKTVDKLDQ